MNAILFQYIFACIWMVAGLYCLCISIFYKFLLEKEFPFLIVFYGNQSRIIYALLSVFFIAGGIAFLVYKVI